MTNRSTREKALLDLVRRAFPDGQVTAIHVNWGGSHRRMLLWNRRFDRALRRSRRNQPPRKRGA